MSDHYVPPTSTPAEECLYRLYDAVKRDFNPHTSRGKRTLEAMQEAESILFQPPSAASSAAPTTGDNDG